jgi:hypothetical protein
MEIVAEQGLDRSCNICYIFLNWCELYLLG